MEKNIVFPMSNGSNEAGQRQYAQNLRKGTQPCRSKKNKEGKEK